MEMENYLELSEECSQMIGMFVCLKNDDLSNQIAYFKDVAFYSTIAELGKMTLTAKAQLQDLESGQDFEMELSRFYKTYELINKSSLPSLRFQKSIHTSVIWFGEGIKAM